MLENIVVLPLESSDEVIYEEVAYFTPYGADHVGVFDLKTESFGAFDTDSGPCLWQKST